MPLPNKRYICSIVRSKNGVLKADVVVVAARNDVLAKAKLCDQYNIPNEKVTYNAVTDKYSGEGYKSIRPAETNMYEAEQPEFDNFSSDS